MTAPLPALAQEEEIFRETVRVFAARELAPRAMKQDEQDHYDPGIVLALFDLGVVAIETPEEWGGAGGSFFLSVLAVEDGDAYVLTGRNPAEAGVFLVMANAKPEASHRGITSLLVERDTKGLSIGKKERKLFGGVGYTREYPVEKRWCDAKTGKIYEGTSNMQLQTIAKQIQKGG